MDVRRPLTVVGAGVSTFLLVAVLAIELLAFEFSAIVGLPVGLLAGLGVTVVLGIRFAALGPLGRHAARAYAAFGFSVLLLAGFRYVNVGPSREFLSVDVVVGVSLAAVLGVFFALWVRGRDPTW